MVNSEGVHWPPRVYLHIEGGKVDWSIYRIDETDIEYVLVENTRRAEIFQAIEREREYQVRKWGTIEQNPHTVFEWLGIMQKELSEAQIAWIENEGDKEALRELLQAVAVGIACLEQHGVYEREEPPATS